MVKSIKVLEFTDKLNADKVLVDKLLETPNIEAITSAQVVEILGDQEFLVLNTKIEFLEKKRLLR